MSVIFFFDNNQFGKDDLPVSISEIFSLDQRNTTKTDNDGNFFLSLSSFNSTLDAADFMLMLFKTNLQTAILTAIRWTLKIIIHC